MEQLPIEYYHPEFLKHVGNKLGKLLKVDAITSAAIRGRYARLCVQINMTNPLLKRVNIGSFWQDIVYENLLMLCYRCGRIGHREIHCSEGLTKTPTTAPLEPDTHVDQGTSVPTHETTPWKMVQTRCARAQGPPPETSTRGKLYQRDAHTPVKPRVQPVSPQVHVMCNPQVGSAMGQTLDGLKQPAGFHRDEVASHAKYQLLLQPCEVDTDCMQTTCMNTCPSAEQNPPSFQAMHSVEKTKAALYSAPTQPEHILHNAPLIGPKLLNSHSNKPQPVSHSHSPQHPDSQEIFEQLTIPSNWGLTNLVLIPKVAHPNLITQFRPISLCNTLYKLLSRIIMQRLKPYIAEVINPCQARLMPGHRTSDNIILVQEVI